MDDHQRIPNVDYFRRFLVLSEYLIIANQYRGIASWKGYRHHVGPGAKVMTSFVCIQMLPSHSLVGSGTFFVSRPTRALAVI